MKRIISLIFVFLILFSSNMLVLSAPETTKQPETADIELTTDEKTAKDAYPELRILMKQNRYPYSYYEDGRYQGIYVDYLNKISEKSGINFIYVPYESDEQLEEYFMFSKGNALVATYGDWQGIYRTTDPYTIVEYDLIAPEGFVMDEKESYTVAVNGTDIMLQNYLKDKYPHWTQISCRNLRTALSTANEGKADITFATSYDLHTNLTLFSYKKIAVDETLILEVPVSMAISSISCPSAMVTLLNKYIECEPMALNPEIANKYVMNSLYVPTVREFLAINKMVAVVIFLIILAAAVIMRVYLGKMKQLREIDMLTGIWNREKFINEVKKKLKNNKNDKYLIAIIDIERFKVINDRFGVEIGNQTLKRMAENISAIFEGKGLFARNVNDKFVVLVNDNEGCRELLLEAANMDITINNATYYQLPIKVGVCGISLSEYGEAGVTSFIDRAKHACDLIKGHPDKKINYFTQNMDEKLKKENELETIMRKSLQNNEFVVYYQPKYDLNDNRIIGAEALVRWLHPTKGLISPGDFIPLFEKNGFIVDVDFYVYETVMKAIKTRIDAGKRVVPVSMNVSRCHLNDATFTKRLESLTDKYTVPRDVIEMEITESIFSDEDEAAVALMDDLKEHNFQLSMDDFGSGYSSLNLLRELPIDTLKIDKGFLDQTDNSVKSRVIVEEIIQMATRIQIRTICEGVETEQQRDFLKQAGCHMAQGFFYARPMPQKDFEELLDAEN